jgi:hypothetical protein
MHNKGCSGFTLLQLAISLIAIGLIMGGMLIAKNFIDQFRVRSVISDYSEYQSAVRLFRRQYDAFPGDFNTASTFWSGASNGDGNGYIGGNEDLYAWDHLQKAGLIGGTYTGVVYSGSLRYKWDINAPGSKIDGAGFTLRTPGVATVYSYSSPTNTNLISFSNLHSTNGTGVYGAVTPMEAYSIDTKIDDGQATSGRLYALKGFEFNGVAGRCVSADYYSATSATYVVTDTKRSCRLWFWMP